MGSNSYMDEVIHQQQAVAMELKAKTVPARAQPAQRARGGGGGAIATESSGGGGIDVRISGWWRFQTVVVPPNVWVVHTRRGHADPLHLGMGTSFRFDPVSDSFIVAPATMQTLAINAKRICAERQGVLVQAYVQWIVDDFAAAYKKLDFSDQDDPMRIVNVQLREQAEASIKDKVATMSIDDILADKRPIIDELTARLRSVAEGQGLKIVQVQIKEAVISSTSVWENLQRPFREEKARLARVAELDRERFIHEREVKDQVDAERARLAAEAETSRLRQTQEVELMTARAALEEARVSADLAQQRAQQQIDAERAKAELATLEAAVARARVDHDAKLERSQRELELEAARRTMQNDISDARLQELLVAAMPAIAEKLPRHAKSEVVTIGAGADPAAASLVSLVAALRAALAPRSTS